jgi:hypothetical protein
MQRDHSHLVYVNYLNSPIFVLKRLDSESKIFLSLYDYKETFDVEENTDQTRSHKIH